MCPRPLQLLVVAEHAIQDSALFFRLVIIIDLLETSLSDEASSPSGHAELGKHHYEQKVYKDSVPKP